MSGFRVVGSSYPYRGFSAVRLDALDGPDGPFTREVIEHPDAVAIVALDADGRVALVRQHRQPIGGELLELPAGTMDTDEESPETAARRELAEEVGLAAEVLVPLGTVWNSAGWSDERTFLFLAERTYAVARPDGFVATDEEAVMSMEWRDLDTVVAEASSGAIEDAKTIVGAVRARAWLDRSGSASDARD